MSDEKRRVLEMLEAGKIAPEDALRLLEALGESGGLDSSAPAVPQNEAGRKEEESVKGEADEMDEDAAGNSQAGEAVPSAEYAEIVKNSPESAGQEEGLSQSFSRAMEQARTEVSGALEEVGKALSDTADEVYKAMSGGVNAVKNKIPTLVLEPDIPGEKIEIPPMPDNAPEHFEVCEAPKAGETPYDYADITQEIEMIDIDWIAGPIEIKPYDGDAVRVTEYANRPLNDGQRLTLSVEGKTMKIRWAQVRSFWNNFMGCSKHLVVEIPQDNCEDLEKLKLKNISGKIYVTELKCEEIKVESVSGAVYLGGVTGEELKVSSVSGSVTVEGTSAEDMDLSSTSGKVILQGIAGEDVKVNTVSGEIRAFGNAEYFNLHAVSGGINVRTEHCPERVKCSTVSGKISLAVPENQGFEASYSSMSGRFQTDFPVTGNMGKKNGKAVYGSGAAKFSFETMSGGMDLLKA